MLGEKGIVLILYWTFMQGTSGTPTGNHTCFGVVKHPVTVRVNVTEPVTYRTYTWCLRVPPRCSKYTVQLRDRVKVQTEMHNKTITVCCKGYVEMDYKCVPACPPFNECLNMHCNRTNHCYCSPGFKGVYCSEPCNRGFWGKDCKKPCDCPEGYTCHHLTGDCMLDDNPPKITKHEANVLTTIRSNNPGTIGNQERLLKIPENFSEALKAAPTTLTTMKVTSSPTTTKVQLTAASPKTSTSKITQKTNSIYDQHPTTKIPHITPFIIATNKPTKSITIPMIVLSTESVKNSATNEAEIVEPEDTKNVQVSVLNTEVTEKTKPKLNPTSATPTDSKFSSQTTVKSPIVPEPMPASETISETFTKKTWPKIFTEESQVAQLLTTDRVPSTMQTQTSSGSTMRFTEPNIKLTTNAHAAAGSTMGFTVPTIKLTTNTHVTADSTMGLTVPSIKLTTNTRTTAGSTMESADHAIKSTSQKSRKDLKITEPQNKFTKELIPQTSSTTVRALLQDLHSHTPDRTFSVTNKKLTTDQEVFNLPPENNLNWKTTPVTEQSKAYPTAGTMKKITITKIPSTAKDNIVTFPANMVENGNDISQFIDTIAPIKYSKIENFPPTLQSELDENNILNLSQMLGNAGDIPSNSEIKTYTENPATFTKIANTESKWTAAFKKDITKPQEPKFEINSKEYTTQSKEIEPARVNNNQPVTSSTLKVFKSENTERILNNEEADRNENKQTMGLLKTEPLLAGIFSQSNEEEAVRHFLSGLTFSLGCVTIITITLLMFLIVKQCKKKHKNCMMDEVIMAYSSQSDSATNPLIYNNSTYSAFRYGEGQPTFFCPTFTNTYAEQLNRELRELNYDHPRSTAEPLYAEIAN